MALESVQVFSTAAISEQYKSNFLTGAFQNTPRFGIERQSFPERIYHYGTGRKVLAFHKVPRMQILGSGKSGFVKYLPHRSGHKSQNHNFLRKRTAK